MLPNFEFFRVFQISKPAQEDVFLIAVAKVPLLQSRVTADSKEQMDDSSL